MKKMWIGAILALIGLGFSIWATVIYLKYPGMWTMIKAGLSECWIPMVIGFVLACIGNAIAKHG